MDFFLTILLVSAITLSVIEDLRLQKIPNLFTYPSMAMALGYHALSGGINGFLFSGGGLALGIGLFIIPYILGGMGAGDVKLMGVAGAILGPKGICIASILVILSGGVYGLIIFATHPSYIASFFRRLWITFKTFVLTHQLILIPRPKGDKRAVLCYAVPIAVGCFAYLLMKITGYDLLPRWLGDQFKIFSIVT